MALAGTKRQREDDCDDNIITPPVKKYKTDTKHERKYPCDECSYVATQNGNLTTHKRTHTNERPYKCDYDGCKQAFTQNGNLTAHKRSHTGEKPYKCDYNGCGYASTQSSNLKSHIEAWHTEKGQQRRKREEEKISKLLAKHNIHNDREVQIDFKCAFGDDRGQQFARIDYVIHRPDIQTIFLLETDENEHDWYNVSCETRRMVDVYSSVFMANRVENVVWVRYNPHVFRIDDIKQKVATKDRQTKLIDLLTTYIPTKPMEILYMYYSTKWSETADAFIPVIFSDNDFPDSLKPLCTVV